ncbi:MAG: hypothetical protein E6R03_01935 [Hyphomicrobiaceae bacterium]|nr:MAG: hypothetical protein E6R03_01935 [Hyphomicrobiaceae bacterium]
MSDVSDGLVSVIPEKFMPFTPVKVLNYYDGPRVFTFNSHYGITYLACWDDDIGSLARFFVVEVDDATVASIENGQMMVCDAFRDRPSWAVESRGDVVYRAWLLPSGDRGIV